MAITLSLEASVSHGLSAGGCPQFLVTQASAEPARDGLLARWQSPSYITYRCEGSLVVFYWLQLSQRIDAFQLWCWRRLLKVPGTARRSNWSVLRETNPEDLLEGLMLNAASSLDALCSTQASPTKMRKDRINYSEYPMLVGGAVLGGMS